MKASKQAIENAIQVIETVLSKSSEAYSPEDRQNLINAILLLKQYQEHQEESFFIQAIKSIARALVHKAFEVNDLIAWFEKFFGDKH